MGNENGERIVNGPGGMASILQHWGNYGYQ